MLIAFLADAAVCWWLLLHLRSLKAIYYLQQAGFKNVSYVKGGIPQWAREKLPLADGPDDGSVRFDDDEDDEGSGTGVRVGTLKLPQLSSLFSR